MKRLQLKALEESLQCVVVLPACNSGGAWWGAGWGGYNFIIGRFFSP